MDILNICLNDQDDIVKRARFCYNITTIRANIVEQIWNGNFFWSLLYIVYFPAMGIFPVCVCLYCILYISLQWGFSLYVYTGKIPIT